MCAPPPPPPRPLSQPPVRTHTHMRAFDLTLRHTTVTNGRTNERRASEARMSSARRGARRSRFPWWPSLLSSASHSRFSFSVGPSLAFGVTAAERASGAVLAGRPLGGAYANRERERRERTSSLAQRDSVQLWRGSRRVRACPRAQDRPQVSLPQDLSRPLRGVPRVLPDPRPLAQPSHR